MFLLFIHRMFRLNSLSALAELAVSSRWYHGGSIFTTIKYIKEFFIISRLSSQSSEAHTQLLQEMLTTWCTHSFRVCSGSKVCFEVNFFFLLVKLLTEDRVSRRLFKIIARSISWAIQELIYNAILRFTEHGLWGGVPSTVRKSKAAFSQGEV